MDYDIIVIGAGHNGLITAAYAAQAGYRVGVFEKRAAVGGSVVTEERVPGYRFDLGGSAHILIQLTPVIQDLGLTDYNLEYIHLDPLFTAPFDDDVIYVYRDATKTADQLEDKYPGEGAAYHEFIEDWRSFARMVTEMFLTVPSPFELSKKLIFGSGPRLPWSEALASIMQPYGTVVDRYFRSERLKTLLVWMAAQSGPPPHQPLSAPFVLWHPLYHESGVTRPRGGSGMLTQALRAHIEAHGGEVHVDAPVQEILFDQRRTTGIRVNNQVYTSRGVVSATHITETFHHLVPENLRPPAAEHLQPGDGFGAMLRVALDAPVEYRVGSSDKNRIGLQLLCRDRLQIQRAYGDFLSGRPAQDPPLVAMTFSAVDDSLAPPGGEVLWLWGQYFPYELSEGTWDDREQEVKDLLLDQFERYAPGTREHIVGTLLQHPEWLERELHLPRGNIMHTDMSIHNMFFLRPLPGMSGYRTPLDGLYLTGASTHPGGGIMGASGRSAARVLLKDLDRNRI